MLKVKRDKKKAERRKGGKGGEGRRLEARRDELTRQIDAAETRIREIDEQFAAPGYFDRAAKSEVRKLQREQGRLKEQLERLMAEWEEAEEALTLLEA